MRVSEGMKSERKGQEVGVQIAKDTVGLCEDLSLHTEVNGRPNKVSSRKGSFLVCVVKRWLWLPWSKIDPRRKWRGIRVI